MRSTGFGDVEVLSDLFFRERLERLPVPHRLDVVPLGSAVKKKNPTKLIPRVGVEMLKKNPPKSISH